MFGTLRKLLRIEQWYKNALIFLPMVILPQPFLHEGFFVLFAFFGFCFASSITYMINDWIDREADRLHPKKKFRPFAARTVSGKKGLIIAGVLLLLVVWIVSLLGLWYGTWILVYIVCTNLYSFYFKHVPLLDVLFIVVNFLFRTLAGTAKMPPQEFWLYLAFLFFVIVIFLTHKRRSDNKLLGEKASAHKPVLAFYTKPRAYALRTFAASGVLFVSGYLWFVGLVSFASLLGLLFLLLVTSILFTRRPSLVISPHYLLRVWWWDMLVLLVIGLFFLY